MPQPPTLVDILLQRELDTPPIDISPEQSAEQDRLALEAQGQDPQWLQKVRGGFEGGMDFLKGLVAPDTSNNQAPAGEKIGGVLGAIMPLASPLRVRAVRNIRNAALAKQASSISPEVGVAFEQFATKYPRLAAHLADVEAVRPRIDFPMTGGVEVMERAKQVPQITLYMHPGIKTTEAAAGTLAHEGTHVAQALRLADRARNSTNIDDIINESMVATQDYIGPFKNAYDKGLRAAGSYFDNPMEISARVTRELRDIPRNVPNRMAIARERAVDRVRQDKLFLDTLGLPATTK